MSVHITLSVGRGVSRDGNGLPVYDSQAFGGASREGPGTFELVVPPGVGTSQTIARIVNLGADPMLLLVDSLDGTDSFPWPLVPGVPLDLFVREGDEFAVETI